MDKAKGGRPTDKTCHDTGQVSTLPELGISRNQSSQWQKLAKVRDHRKRARAWPVGRGARGSIGKWTGGLFLAGVSGPSTHDAVTQ